eukprot:1151099-Pelagomonas_calceolata.AAC.2
MPQTVPPRFIGPSDRGLIPSSMQFTNRLTLCFKGCLSHTDHQMTHPLLCRLPCLRGSPTGSPSALQAPLPAWFTNSLTFCCSLSHAIHQPAHLVCANSPCPSNPLLCSLLFPRNSPTDTSPALQPPSALKTFCSADSLSHAVHQPTHLLLCRLPLPCSACMVAAAGIGSHKGAPTTSWLGFQPSPIASSIVLGGELRA